MRKAVALVALLALAGIAAVILALVGAFNETAAKPKAPTSFVFDSAYEVKRAEGEVTERILQTEMKSEIAHEGEEEEAEEPELQGKTRIKSVHCIVSPPPPAATRLVCNVLVSVHELHETYKAAHANRWKAVVTMNPTSGALRLGLEKLNNAT
jgi:hypothetical protein